MMNTLDNYMAMSYRMEIVKDKEESSKRSHSHVPNNR